MNITNVTAAFNQSTTIDVSYTMLILAGAGIGISYIIWLRKNLIKQNEIDDSKMAIIEQKFRDKLIDIQPLTEELNLVMVPAKEVKPAAPIVKDKPTADKPKKESIFNKLFKKKCKVTLVNPDHPLSAKINQPQAAAARTPAAAIPLTTCPICLKEFRTEGVVRNHRRLSKLCKAK